MKILVTERDKGSVKKRTDCDRAVQKGCQEAKSRCTDSRRDDRFRTTQGTRSEKPCGGRQRQSYNISVARTRSRIRSG